MTTPAKPAKKAAETDVEPSALAPTTEEIYKVGKFAPKKADKKDKPE